MMLLCTMSFWQAPYTWMVWVGGGFSCEFVANLTRSLP